MLGLSPLMTTGISLLVVVIVLLLVDRLLQRQEDRRAPSFQRHTVMIALTVGGVLVVISTLPPTWRGSALQGFGVLVSGVLAFSSTTLVRNGMAGLMLRNQGHFRAGDFVEVREYFGRVSGQGLFFTEIQDELRDLVTIPNAYLASEPVRVIRSRGTLVAAEVSLGYDVHHELVEAGLIAAAEAAGLTDAFVRVLELGDFSIRYRVCGLLEKSVDLLSVRSTLKRQMLDQLHGAGIEIVSPSVMIQRRADSHEVLRALAPSGHRNDSAKRVKPESVIFDKADGAATLERLYDLLEAANATIDALQDQLKESEGEVEKASLQVALERQEKRRELLRAAVTKRKRDDERRAKDRG